MSNDFLNQPLVFSLTTKPPPTLNEDEEFSDRELLHTPEIFIGG